MVRVNAPVDTPSTIDAAGAVGERPWSWHLHRAVSIVLTALVPVWFAGWFVVPDYGSLSVVELRDRWSAPVWLVLDGTVLLLGLVHGAWGLQSLVRQSRPQAPRLAGAAIWSVTGALVALVLWTLVGFDA